MVLFTPSRPRLARLLMWLLLLLGAFPALAQVPPGNALSFNPSGYNVVAAGMDLPNFGGNFALEAWVRTTTSLPNGIVVAVSSMDNFYLGIDNYAADGHQGQALFNVSGTFISSQTRIDDGRWHHIAGTVTSNAATLYVDGVAEGTGNGYTANYPDQGLNIGSYGPNGGGNGWPGSVDEVRVWSVARSAADIKASFNNVPTVPQAGLLVYYNFNQGTAGGNNAGVTTLPNLAGSGYTGTLRNFTLNGATSNWIESYALVVPTNLAATSATSGTSITATWTAPPVGTVTNYVLDCSTTADYSAGVTTLTPASGSTSATVTGRAVNTRYWLRLRADKTSVTGQGAYSRDQMNLRTASGQTPPGNALAFDGSDDYVRMASGLPATGEFTLEGWVNPTVFSGGLDALVMADNFPAGAMHCQFQGNNLQFTVNGNSPTDVLSATALPTGRWAHVAVVYSASAKTVKFYVNGMLNTAATYTTAQNIAASAYIIGGWLNGGVLRPFNGKLDEIRLYSAALTQAQVQADMRSTTAAVLANLVAYYDFDQGTAGGANTAQTTLVDRSLNYLDGTLNNFALTSGNTTSNFVESYGLVIPTLTAATAVTTSGFTVNWTAPAIGIVNGYGFDYSLSPTFASGVTSLSPASGATSQAVSGLLPNRNYYLRLRADKTSVTGTGAYASGVVRTASGLTPPGNALAFDGADD